MFITTRLLIKRSQQRSMGIAAALAPYELDFKYPTTVEVRKNQDLTVRYYNDSLKSFEEYNQSTVVELNMLHSNLIKEIEARGILSGW